MMNSKAYALVNPKGQPVVYTLRESEEETKRWAVTFLLLRRFPWARDVWYGESASGIPSSEKHQRTLDAAKANGFEVREVKVEVTNGD